MSKPFLIILSVVNALYACVDGAYYEQNQAIANQSWSYDNKPQFEVNIDDASAKYDVFINVRHSPDYNYANLFLLLHEKGVGLKDTSYRKEIALAALDGRWLSTSAGSLFEQQFLAKSNFTFPDTGRYTFAVEQNMRENPLKHIVNVGIKVVKK